jgi:MFS family permease
MKLSLKLLLASQFVFVFGIGLYGPIYSIFVEQLGGSVLDAGIAWAVFLISLGIVEYPMGKFIDKFGKKRMLILATLLCAGVAYSYALANSFYQLLAIQVLAGVAFAVGDPTWDAWYSDLVDDHKSGFQWGLANMVTNVGEGIAILLGGALAYFMGFRSLFLIAGTIALASMFVFLRAKEVVGSKSKKIKHRHSFLFGKRQE